MVQQLSNKSTQQQNNWRFSRATQRGMESRILGVTRRDMKRNEEIRRQISVTDVVSGTNSDKPKIELGQTSFNKK